MDVTEIPFQDLIPEIRKEFTDFANWKDDEADAVDFMACAYLAPFLPREANEKPWMILNGAASSMKGEIMRPLKDYPHTVKADNISGKSFSSQYKDDKMDKRVVQKNALLDTLRWSADPVGPKIMWCQEMTTLLQAPDEQTRKLFADLRAVYDGDYDAHSGNVGHVKYDVVEIGFLGACTEVIDRFLRTNQSLGERTLTFRMGRGQESLRARSEQARRIAHMDPDEKAVFRMRVRNLAHVLLDQAIPMAQACEKGGRPSSRIERKYSDIVGDLTTIITSARTCPLGPKQPVSHSEGPGRITGQAKSFGDAHVLLSGRTDWSWDDVRLIRTLSRDTLHPGILRVLEVLWRGGCDEASHPIMSGEIAKMAHVPRTMVEDQCQQWTIVDWLYKDSSSHGYRYTDFAIELLERTKYFGGDYQG